MEIVVGKTAGFCYGVERAINGVNDEIKNNNKVYCLGEIVHNKNVNNNLRENGVEFIDNIQKVNGKIIIRAHGVKKEIYEQAKKCNIEIKDLTCPSVLRIHEIAKDYADKSYFIILTGKKNHPEVIGIESYCGDNYSIIYDEKEVESVVDKIKKENIDKVLLISQTTYSSKKFDEIKEILQTQLDENIKLEINKTICLSTEVRQKETIEIAKKVDLMIIIGDKKSSNTNKLYDLSCEFCKKVIFIGQASELDLKELECVDKVGIMAGASTPKQDIVNVKNKILGVI